MSEYLLKNVEQGSVNLKKAMNQEVVEVKGIVVSMGIDGFISGQQSKAEVLDNIEHLLTNDQKEIANDIFKMHGLGKRYE